MKKYWRRPKARLLILAAAITLVAGVLTISDGGSAHVSYFGFPGTFITLHGSISEFPAGLAINPIQFAVNVVVIWFILFFLRRAFRKSVWKIRNTIFRFLRKVIS